MENQFDVIIIGAGPGGIFCAYELLDTKKDLKVLLLEKGRSIEKRQCPKRLTNQCVGCKPCSITTGFAGAGASAGAADAFGGSGAGATGSGSALATSS